MKSSHMKPTHQSSPCCLICNQPFEFAEAVDHPEDMDRALICTQHPPIPATYALAEVYATSDDAYRRRVSEISAHIRGYSVQSTWYTTQWFSLLFELSSDDLILIYPIMRRAAIVYIPSALRAPDSPKGLLPLRAERLAEVSGSGDRGIPKVGLRGIVAAIDLGLKIDNIDVDSNSAGDIIVFAFAGNYILRIAGEGWLDLGYEREADDLSFHWLNGREP